MITNWPTGGYHLHTRKFAEVTPGRAPAGSTGKWRRTRRLRPGVPQR